MNNTKILIVEGEGNTSKKIEADLLSLQFTVSSITTSTEKILEQIKSNPTDIILLDFDIIDQVEVFEMAALIKTSFGIPVVFMVQPKDQATLENSEKILPFGYLLKPVQQRDLKITLDMATYYRKSEVEKQQVYAKYRESEEKYKIAFNTTPDAVAINQLAGPYVDINKNFTRIIGYSVEEVIGKSASDIGLWSKPKQLKQFINLLRKQNYVENFESTFRCKSGIHKTTLISARIISLNNEPHILSITRDVTVQRQVDEEFKKSEEKYRELAQSANSIILKTDSEFNITFMNHFALGFFGYTEDEVIGESLIGTIVPEAESTGRNLKVFFEELFQNPDDYADNENENIRKNGERVWIAWRNKGFYDENGNLTGVLCTGYDITDRKIAEKELLVAKENAESANVVKSEFLANMSHEIRTPMNGIIGFTEMLIDTDLDENQLDYTETIKRSGESLLSLINDILDFSKIEAGHMEFEEIDFDPELLVYDVCEMIRPKIGLKPIEILCFIGDSIPSYVKGDPTRFKQVLTNLMGNAPKFTDTGEIEISINVEEETKDQIKLHTSIRDTGIGIPEDKLRTIFEAFKQADGSTTRKYGGTGLGLSICKKIAEQMNGAVWAEKNLDRGSTFHFAAWLQKTQNKTTTKLSPVLLKGKTALIVDDNPANLKILAYNLKAAGIKTIALSDVHEVLPVLRTSFKNNNPVDICILDIQMPEISGYELSRLIRKAKSQISSLPLVALSSLMGNEAKKCQDAGFNGFLSKPTRKEKLYLMLERLLAENKGHNKKTEIKTQYSIREEAKHALNILLVEDNLINQKLARLMLTKAGYHVNIANNGQEAIDIFTATPDEFDLIFMDIQMPVLDGKEATTAIRQKGFEAIPIIAMTAHVMKGDKESCLEAGMNDYISKPISRKAVFDILEKWILK